jgi:poly(A) polymerase
LLAKTYDELEGRIESLMQQEELNKIRPDLSGEQIMQILNLKPSPMVGKAYDFLLELRLERGPLGQEQAKSELLNWWQQQKI